MYACWTHLNSVLDTPCRWEHLAAGNFARAATLLRTARAQVSVLDIPGVLLYTSFSVLDTSFKVLDTFSSVIYTS